MRILAAALVSVVAFTLQAPPIPRKAIPASLGLAPIVELIARGCALGWHRGYWQDPSGQRHWGHYFPSWR